MVDDGEHSKAQLPLLGVVLCCTSIPPEQRSDLASIACRMGAIHKFDLTSDVTHLIVGDSDTPKYKFVAKEREDVKCLLPTWIEAVRLSWMEGGETDVNSLEKQYQLPTFAGLRICVTGFDDLAYRKKLEDLINENGGEYRGNLTRDVTHLIAKEAAGNKYTYAGQWGIRTVSIEWLQQSLERGMILDESLFHLLLPPAERGRNAWMRKTLSTTSLGKRPREGGLERSNSRKLRRTASARLSNESSGIWTKIVGDSVKQESENAIEWHDPLDQGLSANPINDPSKILQTSGEQRFQGEPKTLKGPESPKLPVIHSGGIFDGTKAVLHGFDIKRTTVLQHHLCSHGAEILSDTSRLPQASSALSSSYVILVPHQTLKDDVPVIPSNLQQPTVATEMWVEKCLYSKRLVDPSAHIANTPFKKHPITGFETLTISTTAFQGTDMLHTCKTIQLMGAKFTEDLTPATSVLICNTILPSSEKRQSALRWNVPTVTIDWLLDCIRKGEHLAFDAYLTHPLHPKSVSPVPKPQNIDSRPMEGNVKQASRGGQPNNNTNSAAPVSKKLTSSDPSQTHQAPPFSSDLISKDSNSVEASSIKPSNQHITPSSNTTTSELPQPLRSLSINHSPKPSPFPPKPALETEHDQPPQPAKPPAPSPFDTLGPAISSLLAHHRATKPSAPLPPPRRRRQLLGRAPSNLSARSLSRASSVDTMNTDGVGTPLSGSFPHPPSRKISDAKDPFAQLRAYAQEVEESERAAKGGEEEMQMTQLGYEDVEGRAWRERVVRKMGGEVDVEEGVGKDGSGRGGKREVVRDVGGRKGEGVAGRTRAMGGR